MYNIIPQDYTPLVLAMALLAFSICKAFIGIRKLISLGEVTDLYYFFSSVFLLLIFLYYLHKIKYFDYIT